MNREGLLALNLTIFCCEGSELQARSVLQAALNQLKLLGIGSVIPQELCLSIACNSWKSSLISNNQQIPEPNQNQNTPMDVFDSLS